MDLVLIERYGMVCYGMLWYGMVWCGVVLIQERSPFIFDMIDDRLGRSWVLLLIDDMYGSVSYTHLTLPTKA